MNIIDKNTSLLSKKDILDINTTYYGVNPIYNCYVEMLHGIFKRFDQSPFRNEIGEESSEVAFYIIMKIIDKVLALSKSVAKDEDILIEHYLEQIPVYLFKNYKQIFDFSYVANIKAQCRVIAVCQTLFFCLEYVRKTRGRTALILDAFYSNVDMLDKYCITRGNSLVRESSAVRSQGIEPLMQKKIKKYMENYKKLNADSRISHVIDRKARENAQAQIAHTDMYIAKGKKTGVVLALEAMAKAGWIVDSQGVRVKSTGKAVEQILDIVFNDKKCENARQILSHAKNVNKKDFSSYFKELSDSLSGRV